MKVIRLSEKEFKDRFGDVHAIAIRKKGTEPIVYTPGRISTKDMLHEIYHATKSPMLKEIEAGKKWQTPDEQALEEVRAQRFAAEMGGIGEIPWTMVMVVANILLGSGYKPSTIMGSITRALEEEGYEPLDREHRHDLWEFLRSHSEVK